jgi:hypothetical protein
MALAFSLSFSVIRKEVPMRGTITMVLGMVLVTASGCSLIGGVIDQATGGDEARYLSD